MKRWGPLLLFCFVLGNILGTGCTRRIEQEAAKQIRAVLPEYIGPADRYDVQVQGESTGALMRGRLRSVHIQGHGVQVEPTLTLDRLTLDFDEVSVDTKGKRLQNIGRATFDCRVSAAVLDRYVRQQHTGIAGLRIDLRADSLFVTARPDALGLVEKPFNITLPGRLPLPITVEGKLASRKGTRLDFQPEKAGVSIIPVPRFALDFLANKINPVVDLSRLRVPIQADTVFVRGGYLYFSGTLRPDDLLRLQDTH